MRTRPECLRLPWMMLRSPSHECLGTWKRTAAGSMSPAPTRSAPTDILSAPSERSEKLGNRGEPVRGGEPLTDPNHAGQGLGAPLSPPCSDLITHYTLARLATYWDSRWHTGWLAGPLLCGADQHSWSYSLTPVNPCCPQTLPLAAPPSLNPWGERQARRDPTWRLGCSQEMPWPLLTLRANQSLSGAPGDGNRGLATIGHAPGRRP